MGWSRISDSEKQWSEDAIKKLDGKISVKTIEGSDLMKAYKKQFGKKITADGLYYRFRKMAGLNGKGKSKNQYKVFEKSTYLVYVKDLGVSGFDTEEEVKEFLIRSQILGNVTVFKKAEAKIAYKITIA